jgi:hypothetical protein
MDTDSSISKLKSESSNFKSDISNLLSRPVDQRRREHKSRFAQSVVFGLPVLTLQIWGPALGPIDADRWVPVLQALLAGWVVYLNLGMLAEGLILLPHRVTPDLMVCATSLILYGYSLISVLHIFLTGRLWYRPTLFSLTVLIPACWTGLQWLRLSRRTAR